MATKKKTTTRKSSSGSTPKAKRIVKGKMDEVMREFKHHELSSGRSGRKVKDPKQAIAIGLSEARRSGADIPPSPNPKKKSAKKAGAKKTAKKATAKKTGGKKTAGKRAAKKSNA